MGTKRAAPRPTPTRPGPVEGWKLFRLRRDGSLGPLFINSRQRLYVGVAYEAECHPTPGFAVRPGWHVCSARHAPHLTERGRVWARVRIEGITEFPRPACQGGLWFTAQRMTILEVEAPQPAAPPMSGAENPARAARRRPRTMR